jgi:hypothetical protein
MWHEVLRGRTMCSLVGPMHHPHEWICNLHCLVCKHRRVLCCEELCCNRDHAIYLDRLERLVCVQLPICYLLRFDLGRFLRERSAMGW